MIQSTEHPRFRTASWHLSSTIHHQVSWLVGVYYYYCNRFTALYLGLLGRASNRGNIHPLTYPECHPIFISFFHLLRSIASSLFNLCARQSFCTTSVQVYLLVWSPPPHSAYISLPNQCLLFATHAHTIVACFAVVPRLYHLFLISLSTLYLGFYLLMFNGAFNTGSVNFGHIASDVHHQPGPVA